MLISMSLLHHWADQWADPGKYIPGRCYMFVISLFGVYNLYHVRNSFHVLSIFLIERFEEVGHQSIQRGYIPFSYGTRTCLGNTFAVIEASVTFVHLFKDFSVEPVLGWKPRPGLGISQYAVNGVRVKLIKD